MQYRDVSSDIEPGLAAQWSVSRDGLVWTFRLREGVRFHDGTVLTAQHVVESLDRVIQPNAAYAPSPNVARVLGVVGLLHTFPTYRTVEGAQSADDGALLVREDD